MILYKNYINESAWMKILSNKNNQVFYFMIENNKVRIFNHLPYLLSKYKIICRHFLFQFLFKWV